MAEGRVGVPRAGRSPVDRQGAARIGRHGLEPGSVAGRSHATVRRAGHPDPAGGLTVSTHPDRRVRDRPARHGAAVGLRLPNDHRDRAGRWDGARTGLVRPLAGHRAAGRREGHRTAGGLVDRRALARPAAARVGARSWAHRGAARPGGAHHGAARRAATRSRDDGHPSVDQPRRTSTRRRQR
ncbi:MAG: hypothetical protein K0S97_2574 [Chloroflexota bacterium]|jgi:hypothetical protein|nr:hypothetical protein [Chloroflexota bacterium]